MAINRKETRLDMMRALRHPAAGSMANEAGTSAVQLSSRCPLCNAVFKPSQAEIMDESQQGILFHLTCEGCRSSLLAVVAASKLGLSSFGMVTDLTATDVRRLKRSPSISQEDVLNAFEEINTLTGTFGKRLTTHGHSQTQRQDS